MKKKKRSFIKLKCKRQTVAINTHNGFSVTCWALYWPTIALFGFERISWVS